MCDATGCRSHKKMTNETTIAVTPDVDLVGRAKKGDLGAFEALTNRYEQRV
jgi:hypothetical protein